MRVPDDPDTSKFFRFDRVRNMPETRAPRLDYFLHETSRSESTQQETEIRRNDFELCSRTLTHTRRSARSLEMSRRVRTAKQSGRGGADVIRKGTNVHHDLTTLIPIARVTSIKTPYIFTRCNTTSYRNIDTSVLLRHHFRSKKLLKKTMHGT